MDRGIWRQHGNQKDASSQSHSLPTKTGVIHIAMIQLQEFLVKEEAKKVKEVMEKIGNMQLEKEKKDGEERIKAILKKQREEFDGEKDNAVKEGRQEEQDNATKILTSLMKQHEDDIVRIKQEAEQTKQV